MLLLCLVLDLHQAGSRFAGSLNMSESPEELAARYNGSTNPELTQIYIGCRAQLRSVIDRAVRASRGAHSILSTENRMAWGAVLFTRLAVTAKSIEKLLPFPRRGEHWDFSAVASITRNLLEASLVYHWLCGVGVPEEQREARFILLYLHDHGSRRRLFPDQIIDPDPVHDDLVRRFDANAFLAAFDQRKRAVALKGEKTPFLQDDVIAEMGGDAEPFRFIYRFFSQHTHSGPVAFFRMHEHCRGTGVETRLEKIFMLTAISAAAQVLEQAIETHLTIFPDAETRSPHFTWQQIEANVEREQGRRR